MKGTFTVTFRTEVDMTDEGFITELESMLSGSATIESYEVER
jgi:hypothetical protein